MNTGRIIKTGLAAGVVSNVYDFAVQGYLLPKVMAPSPIMLDIANAPVTWLIISDFVWGLVLAWFFDRVRGSFGPGANGGAMFGFSAGIFANFPIWIILHLVIKDWSYGMSWSWTISGIVGTTIVGAVAGIVYGGDAPKAA